MTTPSSLNKNGPIGVFDSGTGGLTVLIELMRELPNERFVFFGDTAHCPFGKRSAEEIKGFAAAAAEFFLSRGAKLIVLACNYAFTRQIFVSRAGSVFLAARMMQDGLIKPVLDADCPEAGYRMCAYKDHLPPRADAWLWEEKVSPYRRFVRTVAGPATTAAPASSRCSSSPTRSAS